MNCFFKKNLNTLCALYETLELIYYINNSLLSPAGTAPNARLFKTTMR
jgi:hypothetical protein